MNWLDLRKEVIDNRMSYREFEFPLSYDPTTNTFKDATGNQFVFSKPGYNYLVYRLEDVISNKKEFKALYEAKPEDWTAKVNRLVRKLREENESGRGWEVSDNPLITPYRGSQIFGLMTKYNNVSNLSVLDLVEKWGMVNRVTEYSLSDTEFTLFLKSSENAVWSWGLAIRNGETGHATFSYRVYFKSENYTYTFPFQEIRRHMSRINEVEENLQLVFEEVSDMEVWSTIENTPARNYALLLQLKYDKLADVMELFTDERSTLDQLMFKLAKLQNEKGYKVVCKNAMDEIFSLVKFMED